MLPFLQVQTCVDMGEDRVASFRTGTSGRCCTVLYCTTLYCNVLYCTVLPSGGKETSQIKWTYWISVLLSIHSVLLSFPNLLPSLLYSPLLLSSSPHLLPCPHLILSLLPSPLFFLSLLSIPFSFLLVPQGLWARPPPMSLNDPNWHGTEAKYR